MNSTTIARHSVRSAGWALAQNAVKPVISLIIFVTLARVLEPEAYGLVAFAGVAITLITVLVEQGFNDALVQRENIEPGHLDGAFWFALASSVVLMVVLMAGAGALAALLGQPALGPVLQALAALFPLQALAVVPQAMLQRAFAFRTLALRTVLGIAAGGAVAIPLAWNGFGVWSLVAQQLVQSVAGVLVLWQGHRWRPGFAFTARHVADLYRFGRNIIGSSLLDFVNRKADDLIVGLFLGPVALGIYSLSYQVLVVIEQLLCKGFDALALSAFSRLQGDRPRLREALNVAVRWAALLAFPAFIGAALVAPNLVTGFLGAKWLGTVPVIQILMLVGLLHAVLHYNHAIFKACGVPYIGIKLAMIEAVLNVSLFLIAVRWGIVAVAAAYVIRAFLMSPLSLREVRRLVALDVRRYLNQLALPLAATVVLAAVVTGVGRVMTGDFDARAVFIVQILTGIVVYAVSLLLLAPALLGEARAQLRNAGTPAESSHA